MTASCKEKSEEFTLIFFEMLDPKFVCWVRFSYQQEKNGTDPTLPQEEKHTASFSSYKVLFTFQRLIRSLLVLDSDRLAGRLKLWHIMPLSAAPLCCCFVFIHLLPRSRCQLAGGRADLPALGLHPCLTQATLDEDSHSPA